MQLLQSERARLLSASGALLILSLILTVYSSRNPGFAQGGFVVMSEVVAPLQQVTTDVAHHVQHLWGGYVDLVTVQQENDRLKLRVNELELEAAAYVEARFENERLQTLLKIEEQNGLGGSHARVIGVDPSGWVKAVFVDKGWSSGVKIGMGVVSGSGIVGQVVATGRTSSRVLLLTDLSSGVDAILQDTRIRGTLEGDGQSKGLLKFVPRDITVASNQRVVTSGMDGVFPKGLLIGTVEETASSPRGMFLKIEVKTAVELDKLEDVLVLPSRPVELTSVYHRSGPQNDSLAIAPSEDPTVVLASKPTVAPPTGKPAVAPPTGKPAVAPPTGKPAVIPSTKAPAVAAPVRGNHP